MTEASYRRQLDQTWSPPRGFLGWLKTVNQTNIGKRYLLTGFIFLLSAGVLALLMRTQLALPENSFMGPKLYNQMFTMHGITMMFLFAIPVVQGISVYLVPLMIGTRDLAFPRLSAFSYFVYLIGALFLWGAFLLGLSPDAGWFNYVPLAGKEFSPGKGIDVYATVITFIEISALATATELIATILKQRAPGMSLAKTPPLVWSILVTAAMIVFAMPGVIVGTVLLALDRLVETGFFVHAKGGDPVLWQHLFWWFGHPDVYIAFLPAAGIVSTILPVFCRRPLFGYTAVVTSMVATGVISFGLWVHHMFTTGIPIHAGSFFSAASVLIAIPSGIQLFCWTATIWGSRPSYKTPFLYCLGFMVIFLLGGLTGFMVAIVPFDLQVHDSYFVVAHFHYVLIGGVVFPFIAGFFYWWPKITGRMLSEALGKLSFVLLFLGFNLTFFPMHQLGFLGMPRRIYTFLAGLGWDALNFWTTVGAFAMGLGFFVILINVLWSLKRGKRAGKNPWGATTLEWATTSPPPNYNFEVVPYVDSLEPLSEDQKELVPGVTGIRADRREILTTKVESAKPHGVVILPGPTLWPFITALFTAMAFIGSIFDPLWFVGGVLGSFTGISLWLWIKKPWEQERRRV